LIYLLVSTLRSINISRCFLNHTIFQDTSIIEVFLFLYLPLTPSFIATRSSFGIITAHCLSEASSEVVFGSVGSLTTLTHSFIVRVYDFFSIQVTNTLALIVTIVSPYTLESILLVERRLFILI
jgi:hypothetical protein